MIGATFTPGPWIEAGPSYGKGKMQKVTSIVEEVEGIDGDMVDDICFFPDYLDDDINRANACLIAAAPDMYAALQAFLADDPDAKRKAVDALAKAEGRAS